MYSPTEIHSLPIWFNDSLLVWTTFSMDLLGNQWSYLAQILHALISARSWTCHKFLKLYQAFFLTRRAKKKPGRTSKILGNLTDGADIGTGKLSARLEHRFPLVQLTGIQLNRKALYTTIIFVASVLIRWCLHKNLKQLVWNIRQLSYSYFIYSSKCCNFAVNCPENLCPTCMQVI